MTKHAKKQLAIWAAVDDYPEYAVLYGECVPIVKRTGALMETWAQPLCRALQGERGLKTECVDTCTTAIKVIFLAAALDQSGHMWVSTTYSTTKVCCKIAPLNTSLWTVNFVLSLRECGSVQIKPASTSLTCSSEHIRILPSMCGDHHDINVIL